MRFRHTLLHGVIVSGSLVGLAVARPASAQTRTSITTLFSTGVTATGLSSAANSADLHYSLSSYPAGATSSTSLFVTQADGFPIGPWLDYSAANGNSRWIEPSSGITDTHAEGTYVFRTTFSLAGFAVNSAQLSLKIAVDNDVSKIRVNGVDVANSAFSGFSAFSSPFSITSSNATFQSGTNTIDFYVVNGSGTSGNPVGLRVDATGTAIMTPEPAVLPLLTLGLAGLGGVSYRARKRKTGGVH